jgi:hypothetical protein
MCGLVKSQSLKESDIILTANYGFPHLFKNIVKIGVNRNEFKSRFNSSIEVSNIKGTNPIAIKGEYALTNYFGLGFSTSFWSISFDVKDYYNIQNQNQGTIIKDSVDVYSFRIDSRSFGIRPNLHIPLESRSNDIYLGLALGITKNKLRIGFSSTDAGRVAKAFGKDVEYDLSLPGGVYFAPSLGYRHYFGEYVGINFEIGYEKGAILQAGISGRFNYKK